MPTPACERSNDAKNRYMYLLTRHTDILLQVMMETNTVLSGSRAPAYHYENA
jgi:hypothetical protein